MIPLMQEYRAKYPSMPLYLRGDSGFASPDLYEACEENDCKYAIRLKQNATLIRYTADADEALFRATRKTRSTTLWNTASSIIRLVVGLIQEEWSLMSRNRMGRWYICSHSS